MSQEAFGWHWGEKKIGQKQRAYNVLELEEHLSLGSGAGSDLLKTPASKDTSPETRHKDVLHLKRSFPHSGYADVSFWVLGTAFPRDSQGTHGLCLSLSESPCGKERQVRTQQEKPRLGLRKPEGGDLNLDTPGG